MDLIINSGSDLASKVINPFSSHCSEKYKLDTLFSGFEFMTSDALPPELSKPFESLEAEEESEEKEESKTVNEENITDSESESNNESKVEDSIIIF
ncbi:hypothetical protein C1645_829300 [Glomus cerebriforme]|uniref:Uncharacterized protein n=1 Tax=Glomus cerebriforme TaxID=658196 RepID=A0A397SUM8_9GLOM|nr:hypothetical protein C1645_829300 [Glomus cerebriforme]